MQLEFWVYTPRIALWSQRTLQALLDMGRNIEQRSQQDSQRLEQLTNRHTQLTAGQRATESDKRGDGAPIGVVDGFLLLLFFLIKNSPSWI
jgi:hypothetical protein